MAPVQRTPTSSLRTRAQAKPASSSRGLVGSGRGRSPAACASQPQQAAAALALAQLPPADGAVQLRELPPARLAQQQMVSVARRGEPERALQHDVQRRASGEIAPAHDARHALRRVVDDDGEVVRDRAVAAPQHRVAQLAIGIEREVEPGFVARLDAPRREPQAQRTRRSRASRRRAARAGDTFRGSARSRRPPRAPRALDFRAAAGARVEKILPCELVERRLEARLVLALQGMGVPVETQPFERRQHVLRVLGAATVGVDVFEAQREARAEAARVEPGEQPGEQRPGMRRAGRGGREAAVFGALFAHRLIAAARA